MRFLAPRLRMNCRLLGPWKRVGFLVQGGMTRARPQAKAFEWLMGLAVASTCFACEATDSSVRPPRPPVAGAAEAPKAAARAKPPEPVPVTLPAVPEPEPPVQAPERRNLADSFRHLDPGFRFEMAEAVASYGSSATAEERRLAYAAALTLIDAFPTDHHFAPAAALLGSRLRREQQSLDSDGFPVSEAEQAEFLARVLRDADSAPPEAQRPPSSTVSVPRDTPPAGNSPPPVYNYVPSNPGGEVRVRGYTKANGTYVAPYNRSAPRR
jgi:hypothetical protein